MFPEHRPSGQLADTLAAVRAERLTFLTADQLDSLASCVLELEAAGREGILVEAGTARSGSAIAMALAKSAGRELRVYDVFGMIPPPTEQDGEDVCLERLAPRIVPGGRLVIDDYFNWSGCRTAVDTYFADHPEFRLEMRAKVHAVRLPRQP